jgi:alpha/beta superfamily hydrolase
MGGDMQNPVVLAAERGLVGAGFTTLRFNFGGVGRSEGGYGGGDAEVGDVDAAVDALKAHVPEGTPLVIVGYSFGAWVGARAAVRRSDVARLVLVAPPADMIDFGFLRPPLPPCTVIAGDDDAFCHHPERLASVASVRVLEGADHFFWGYDEEIAAAVAEVVSA